MLMKIKKLKQENFCFIKATVILTISMIFASYGLQARANGWQPEQMKPMQVQEKLRSMEKDFDGKIGVYALDTNTNQIIAYRANERFPIQSTMKLLVASDLLKKSEKDKNILHVKIHYTKKDLIFWAPVTRKYVANGMSFEELAEAAISYSDNPAANLLTKKLGGPGAITNFAHSIGNKSYNLTHYDGYLNSSPDNKEDTSTPENMAVSMQKLTLGNILSASEREKLITWLRNNTVGYKRIRAGTPLGWVVADKTGSGDFGVANDVGILWAPQCKPIVLAIYTVRNKKEAERREDIIASATSIVMDAFSKSDNCFETVK